MEALPQRVLCRERAERGDGLLVPAELEFRVEAPFEGLEAGLRELVDPERGALGVGEGRQVGEGRAAPQRHGERGLPADLLPVLAPVGVPYGPDARLEDVGVELALVDEQLVAGGEGAQALLGSFGVHGGEEPAEPGEVVGEGGVGAGGDGIAPQGLFERVPGDGPVRLEQQCREEDADLGSADGTRLRAVVEDERPEQSELHHHAPASW